MAPAPLGRRAGAGAGNPYNHAGLFRPEMNAMDRSLFDGLERVFPIALIRAWKPWMCERAIRGSASSNRIGGEAVSLERLPKGLPFEWEKQRKFLNPPAGLR